MATPLFRPLLQVEHLEHDAEKYDRFSDDIMLYFFVSRADSDFRPNRLEIIRL